MLAWQVAFRLPWIKHQNISKPLVWIGGGYGLVFVFSFKIDLTIFDSFYHTRGVWLLERKACRYPLFCLWIICSISKQNCWFRGRSTCKQKSEENLAVSYSYSCKIPRCQMLYFYVFVKSMLYGRTELLQLAMVSQFLISNHVQFGSTPFKKESRKVVAQFFAFSCLVHGEPLSWL